MQKESITQKNILEVNKLSVRYKLKDREFFALKNVSFTLKKAEVLGVVGESGSGKTTLALSILRVLPENAFVSGKVIFDGEDIFSLNEKQFNFLRSNKISLIFQEPALCFDPLFSIDYQFNELLKFKANIKDKKERQKIIFDSLEKVKISEIDRILKSFPHQLSGGQLQRIAIAMSISLRPILLIADEPTSSLDVTIESQIIHLFKELKNTFGLTMIFITHNLELAKLISDKILVLYKANAVEFQKKDTLFRFPKHPYTKALIDASKTLY